jgi:TonB-dependent receptor-like protein/carboxypeptidase family protein
VKNIIPGILLVLFLAARTQGQSVLEGRVLTRGDSALASVYIEGHLGTRDELAFRLLTDARGGFRQRVVAGSYRLRVSHIGFAAATVEVVVQGDSTTHVSIVLEERALELRPITVAAERARAEFETNAGQTSHELAHAELKLIPGLAETDVLRAIEVLPGVVSTSDFSSAFNVRGGSADQNLIALDGFPIFNPFHLGGLFSVFNSDMVNRAELQAGGFPAQYGGRVSSVLNVESDPGPRGLDVRGGVSLLATRLTVAADAAPETAERLGLQSARARVAARRSYFDQLFRPFFEFPYHLTDVQTYLEGWTRAGHRISLTGYTGRDLLNFVGVDSFPLEMRWNWGNDVVGGRWFGHLRSGAQFDARLGYSRFNTAIFFPGFGDTHFGSRIQQGLFNIDLLLPASKQFEPRFGAEVSRLGYANLARTGGTVFRQGSESGWLTGVYAQTNWRPGSPWLIEAGLRSDAWFSGDDAVVLQPRVAAKLFLDQHTAAKLALGRYAQFLHSLRDEELPIGIDIWVLAGQRAPYVVSDQVQAGLEAFRGNWYTSLEGYYRHFDGVTANNMAEDPNNAQDDLLAGRGTSYGVDFLLRRDEGRLRGFLSASWLKARRTFPDANSGEIPAPEQTFAPVFDRRLDLDLVLRTTLPRDWEAGLRWNFGSGLPFTKPLGSYLYYEYHIVSGGRRRLSDSPDSATTAILIGPRNGTRYPAYHRLDFSLRKTMRTSWGQLNPYLEVLNVYNRKNVLFYFYDYNRNPAVRSGVSMFPLLPTIGAELVF